MKVKLLVGRSGPDLNQVAGEEIDVGEDEGKRMIAAGQAEAVRSARKETATKKTEKATKG